MGKIAVAVDRALADRAVSGAPGRAAGRLLAQGGDWSVEDVICTSGPGDRSFEEQHPSVSIGVVVAGSFQFRSPLGTAMMTPGSLLLSNASECFECGHEHAAGDRCVAFRFAPDYFERLAADAGLPRGGRRFRALRLPPMRESSALVAGVSTAVSGGVHGSWEEMAIEVAASAIRLAAGLPRSAAEAPGSVARVTDSVRAIERDPAARWTLRQLAERAGKSRFHYLRTFERLTGLTPHQFILRTRLRDAALRLATQDARIIDIALESGYADISNFNRSFVAEFGVAPATYKRVARSARP